MNDTMLAMNFCWNSFEENKLKKYKEYINWCYEKEVKLFRIIMCKWGINCIYNKNDIEEFKAIIKYAQEKDIKIVLVLLNYTDFNTDNYLDINDSNFSWKTNKYNNCNKTSSLFFKTINKSLLKDIDILFKEISSFNNILYVEIMNEIDQINCNNKLLVKWTNELIEILKQKYSKYIFTCSISNYEMFEFFKNNLNCYVDLHSYGFPTNSAINNIIYTSSKQNILYLGEYSKHSDYSYINNLDSKIYFTSGIWASYFLNLSYSAMSWWWNDIISSIEYNKIIDFYKEYKDKILINKFNKINDYSIYNKKASNNDSTEKNKVCERLLNIMKHPLFILKEIKNIKKYLKKRINKNIDINIFKINDKPDTYYIECYNKYEIYFDKLIKENSAELFDLVNRKKVYIKINSNKKNCLQGCYILRSCGKNLKNRTNVL